MDEKGEGHDPQPRRVREAQRRRQIQALSAQGLSITEIGQRLGISKQRVHQVLKGGQAFPVRCRICEGSANSAGAKPEDDRAVLCLSCLAKNPEATFGEYLKAFRLASGMTVVNLAAKTGVPTFTISAYEEGRRVSPTWPVILRLFQSMGVYLIMIPKDGKKGGPG